MGQQCSTEDVILWIKQDLSLKKCIPHACSNDGTESNIHSFVTVVGRKWLDNLHSFNEVTVDSDSKEITIDFFQSTFNFPDDSLLRKVILHVIKKDIQLTVYVRCANHNINNEEGSIAGLLSQHHQLCQSQLTNDASAKSCNTEVIPWEKLVGILKSNYCSPSVDHSNFKNIETSHFQPLVCMYETADVVYIFEDYSQYNLVDAMKYTPSLLEKNHTSLLFLFYQILKIFLQFRKLGLQFSSNLTLTDFYLNNKNLWLSISPYSSVIYKSMTDKICKQLKLVEIYKGIHTDFSNIKLEHKLSVYTDAWCRREISNFDYLIILNILSGRKFGESLNHPVFPWVTNFLQHNGGLRNLSKTKFRLNKGDRQLDATYSAGSIRHDSSVMSSVSPIQHHVSDVLSDITYYIYHARDTSKDILCRHVRPRWVPDEYPNSVERIYDWTPDECIPEFFYDPNIFISIHNDLNDLGLPKFINSPAEFVEYHYNILESNQVSTSLHKWIDLIFGYALEGSAAKENKNVHLSLIDDHKSLRNYGVIQLFTHPHPKRIVGNMDDVVIDNMEDQVDGDVMLSWEYVDLTSSMKKDKVVIDQEEGLLKKQRSRSANDLTPSLHQAAENNEEPVFSTQHIDIGNINFLDVLENTEYMLRHELEINPANETGIGKYEFGSVINELVKQKTEYFPPAEIQLFVSLLIEIVLHKHVLLRTFQPSIEERYKENIALVKLHQNTPRWLHSLLWDMIGDDSMYHPSPFAAIHLLNPGFNFPTYFQEMHNYLSALYCAINENRGENSYVKLTNQIESCCHMLQDLLDELNSEGKDTLLSYLLPLFQMENVQIAMFTYVFPSLSHVLGPQKSTQTFVKFLQNIYDSIKCPKNISLLQQTFLSKALSSFGQDNFLQSLMGYILDTFTINNRISHDDTGIYSNKSSYARSTSVLSENALKSNSLISYEVSPVMGETDSLCSLHLDQIFHEGFSQLSKEYTDSFVDIDEEPSDTEENNFEKQNYMPVSSSQEITEAGIESLIDINTAEVGTLSGLIKDNESIRSFSYNSEQHFTVLLTEEESVPSIPNTYDSEDLDEVLEDVPHHIVDLEIDMDQKEGLKNIGLRSETTHVSLNLFDTVVESVKWLIPWLGPKLTTEYIAIPLLKRMSRLFFDYELNGDCCIDAVDNLIDRVYPIIDCLVEVPLVYGDTVVLYHYLPHVSKIIDTALNSTSISISLGSSLVSCVQLITETCKLLHGETISKHIEMFSEIFFQPLIRLLSTVKAFSTGSIVRKYLARKVIDIFGLLCQKLNRENAQEMMAPLLQQFFSCFDGIYTLRLNDVGDTYVTRKYSLLLDSEEDDTLDHDLQTRTNTRNSRKIYDRISSNKMTIDEVLENDKIQLGLKEEQFYDMYETFSPSLAYHAYVLLGRVLGTLYIEKTLYNSELIWQLCTKHDEGLTLSSMETKTTDCSKESIHIYNTGRAVSRGISKWCQPIEPTQDEEVRFSSRSMWQEMYGHWEEHWKDHMGDCKQYFQYNDLKLQTYAGHSSAIRDLYVPDNEHFFLSASRDKTVKLWLLKNHGNGTAHLGCSRTYDEHSRAVFSVQGIEAKRWVASCDGAVNVWDPVTGQSVCEFDAGRGNTVTSIRTLPAPSTCIAVATTEGKMRLFDVRQRKYAQDWKLSPQASTGMVRSICASGNGAWIAAGFSSGIVSVVDLQAGVLRGQSRVHDGEIIQMESIPGLGFVSSSMDWNLRLWHEDGSVSHIKKISNECIHSVVYANHLMVWATSNNKLSLHNVEKLSSFQSNRISQETFKGNLTKMAVLPLNKLYLFGADNGNVVLCA